ncbi:hypothetical protein BDF14DRAFT_1746790 [Spinellus fusiger]|nr:hypothetical protein BDF14DRAFT_1746790 [Spinellus fusiger]
MSLQMADSYRQLSEMLGHVNYSLPDPHSPPTPNDTIPNDTTPTDTTHDKEEETRSAMTVALSKAAMSNNVDKVRRLLQDPPTRALIDLDSKDEDGTTPLIYAVCFGKAEICQLLLEAGANPDVQDAFGWSALMWATNNSHESLVKLLLEFGASSQQKSAKGRTVFDFVNTENQKIIDILATNPRDSISSMESGAGHGTDSVVSSRSSHAGDCDFYYQSTVEGFDSFMAEEENRHQQLIETAMHLAGEAGEEEDGDDYDGDYDGDYSEEEQVFEWDKCRPDQMFVFNSDDLDYILDTVITHLQLPVKTKQEICVPANVTFLSARFAHYFSSDELAQNVLEGALDRIHKAIKANPRNIHVLAFWITNLTQILYYLKKDGGLVIASAEHQLRLSELVLETYQMMISDTERRLSKIIGPAMLDYEQIPGMEDVNFADDWQRFFRRSSRRSVIVPPDGALAVQMNYSSNDTSTISPHSMTSLLDSILFVFDSYNVHPTITIQVLAQIFHFVSCELFNRILTNKKLLCRSKAMQIRLNLSCLEDWVQVKALPSSLVTYLEPTIQLLQLLQCMTQLGDLPSFINTLQSFDALNSLQVKRCLFNYRYEVNEQHLPEEVEMYAAQWAEDSLRYKQARPSMSLESLPLSRAHSLSLQQKPSRRDSVSSFVGSLMSSVGISASVSLPPTPTTEHYCEEPMPMSRSHSSHDGFEYQLDPKEDTKEIKDSKFMLPFSIPTTAHMAAVYSSWGGRKDAKLKEDQAVPVIPEEWMEKLDNISHD